MRSQKSDQLKARLEHLASLKIPSVNQHLAALQTLSAAPQYTGVVEGAVTGSPKTAPNSLTIDPDGPPTPSPINYAETFRGSENDSVHFEPRRVSPAPPKMDLRNLPCETLTVSELNRVKIEHPDGSPEDCHVDGHVKSHEENRDAEHNHSGSLERIERVERDERTEWIDRLKSGGEANDSCDEPNSTARSTTSVPRSAMPVPFNLAFPGKLKSGFCGVANPLFYEAGHFDESLDFMVYLHLYFYSYGQAQGSRLACISDRQLTDFTGASRNTVKRALSRLVRRGWILPYAPPEAHRVKTTWYVRFLQDQGDGPGQGGTASDRDAVGGARIATGSGADTVQNSQCPKLTVSGSNSHTVTVSKLDPLLRKEEKKQTASMREAMVENEGKSEGRSESLPREERLPRCGTERESENADKGAVSARGASTEWQASSWKTEGTLSAKALAVYLAGLQEFKRVRETRALDGLLGRGLTHSEVDSELKRLRSHGMPDSGVVPEFPLCFFEKHFDEISSAIRVRVARQKQLADFAEVNAFESQKVEIQIQAEADKQREQFERDVPDLRERVAHVRRLAPEFVSFGLEHPLTVQVAARRWCGIASASGA